jgi:hypothetical protein
MSLHLPKTCKYGRKLFGSFTCFYFPKEQQQKTVEKTKKKWTQHKIFPLRHVCVLLLREMRHPCVGVGDITTARRFLVEIQNVENNYFVDFI